MRSFYTVFLLSLCLILSGLMLASQATQRPQATEKPLTNVDVLDMLKAGLSPEIVIAKIRASACEFCEDTPSRPCSQLLVFTREAYASFTAVFPSWLDKSWIVGARPWRGLSGSQAIETVVNEVARAS